MPTTLEITFTIETAFILGVFLGAVLNSLTRTAFAATRKPRNHDCKGGDE